MLKFIKKATGWLFDDCNVVPKVKKNKKIFLEVISNSKIFNILIFFNEIANDQDFPKLAGGLDKGKDWTTSNKV